MRVVVASLLALLGAVAGCSHSEPPPCTPADYAALSASCDDCAAEIEARRALCEKLIRKDDARGR